MYLAFFFVGLTAGLLAFSFATGFCSTISLHCKYLPLNFIVILPSKCSLTSTFRLRMTIEGCCMRNIRPLHLMMYPLFMVRLPLMQNISLRLICLAKGLCKSPSSLAILENRHKPSQTGSLPLFLSAAHRYLAGVLSYKCCVYPGRDS